MNGATQVFNVPSDRKDTYGEITTPYWLIEEMLNVLFSRLTENEIVNFTFADCAAGYGYFGISLYHKLFNHPAMANVENRAKQIKSRIHLYEINEFHREELVKFFGDTVHIQDFLTCDMSFNVVMGNPPYHINGIKKVPTNGVKDKKKDGRTIWMDFVSKAVEISDYVLMITPSIWMKYGSIYKYHHIHSYTNTETNRIFKGKAQTPTCYFLMKTDAGGQIDMLENGLDAIEFVENWNIGKSIPLCGYSQIRTMERIREKYNLKSLKPIKTNCLSKKYSVSNKVDTFVNIKSAHMERRDGQMVPVPILEYSHEPIPYSIPKVVCAHKMYGLPIADMSGQLGISARDNYVFPVNDRRYAMYLQHYLHSDVVQMIMNSARYRMKYLEKECWEWIPDIWEIPEVSEFDYGSSLCEYDGEFHIGICERLNEFNELIVKLSSNL